MTGRRHSQEEATRKQIVIITGEEGQGQNIVAMMYMAQSLRDRVAPFHNDCSNRGFRISSETLSDESEFLELLNVAPDGSPGSA